MALRSYIVSAGIATTDEAGFLRVLDPDTSPADAHLTEPRGCAAHVLLFARSALAAAAEVRGVIQPCSLHAAY